MWSHVLSLLLYSMLIDCWLIILQSQNISFVWPIFLMRCGVILNLRFSIPFSIQFWVFKHQQTRFYFISSDGNQSNVKITLKCVCVCHLECKTIFMHLCVTTKSSGDMKIIILARNITACSPQSQRTDIHEKSGAQCNFHDIEPSRIYRNLWKIVIFAQAANSVLKIPANCFRYWAVSSVVTVASSKNISRYIIKSHT